MLSSLKDWIISHNLVLIIILIYILISIVKLEHPGVNNDQLMFIDAAVFNPEPLFIWESFKGFPSMIFPYIGALKSYIYMPIFYFFDVNIWTIRIPHIILISLSLLFLYKTLLIAFNKKIALLSTLLLSLDPSLIAYSRVDFGPIVIEFLLKILSIYMLVIFLKTLRSSEINKKQIFYLALFFFVLMLGIFNKINFLWFVNALIFSFILIYGKDFYKKYKKIDLFFPLVVILIPYLFLIRLFIKFSKNVTANYQNYSSEVTLTNIISNFPQFGFNLLNLINGNLFFQMVYGRNVSDWGVFVSILFVILFTIGLVLSIKIKEPVIFSIHQQDKSRSFFYRNKTLSFFILITLLISLQILLTKRATSAWHVLSLYPFLIIIFVLSTLKLLENLKSSLAKRLLSGFIIIFIIYQLSVNFIYIYTYSSPAKVAWSSQIYKLVDFARNTNKKFICLDVDICNQLFSLTGQQKKYKEPFAFLDPNTNSKTFDNLKQNFGSDNYLYISHAENNSHFPNVRMNFLEAVENSNYTPVKVKEFKDKDNAIFEVYVLVKI